MNNFSNNISCANHSLTRTAPNAAEPGRNRTRLLMHTATALSVVGPRRVAAGGQSRRRKTKAGALVPRQAAAVHQPAHETRRPGVRVREIRESAGRGQRPADGPDACSTSVQQRPSGQPSRKSRKEKDKAKGSTRPPRLSGARAGSTASAGSRRRQRRSEALDDFSLVSGRTASVSRQPGLDEPVHNSRSRRRAQNDADTRIPLGQHNFTRIQDDLAGAYRLVEDVVVTNDKALPLGNKTHPFTGTLESANHRLSVQLERPQGDAVLFGCIDNSRINLTLTDTRLETRNGSLAALVGEMRSGNHLHIARLHNCTFSATGEGRVEAGLVGTTSGTVNRIDLYDATDNRVLAHALPPSGPCSGSCQPAAAVSLGLGALRLSPFASIACRWQYICQRIIQRRISDNRLQALSDSNPAGWQQATNTSSVQATAALVGLLGDTDYGRRSIDIISRQDHLHNNQILARANGSPAGPQHPDITGYSCASLGYGDLSCDPSDTTEPLHWLYASQVACRNNSVLAHTNAGRRHRSAGDAQTPVRSPMARATLVSTETVAALIVQHRETGPGQLEVQAEGGQQERALLGPARVTAPVLCSGDSGDLPLLARWGGAGYCSLDAAIDATAYALNATALNCVPAPTSRWAQWVHTQGEGLKVSSLHPSGWRLMHNMMVYSELFFAFDFCALPYGTDSVLHYPDEALQSLVSSRRESFLVSRQHYPWLPENDASGLLRVTPYRIAHLNQPQAHGEPERGGIRLYQPHPRNLVLQTGAAVYALVQGQQLHQLYQGPGLRPQVVSLPLNVFNGHYQLAEYEMEGRARLLSLEDGELHLWMQQNNSDTLFVYGLGSAPAATNTSSWLRWGFDLSDQPGGLALLARDGDWLYSVRQQDAQPASLRRMNVSTGLMDAAWQHSWPGNITDQLRLAVDQQQLTALPVGTLVAPRTPASGFQAHIPHEGGCVHWSEPALARHVFPRAVSPAPVPDASVTASPFSVVPTGAPVTDSPSWQSPSTVLVAGSATGSAVVAAAVSLAASCIGFLVWNKCKQRQAAVREERSPLIENKVEQKKAHSPRYETVSGPLSMAATPGQNHPEEAAEANIQTRETSV